MPSVTNLSSDALNMPSVGGLALDPGETKEVDVYVASELFGHPLLRVDGWQPDEPAPEPQPEPTPEAPAEPAPTQE